MYKRSLPGAGLLVTALLLFSPLPAPAQNLDSFAEALESLADMTRAADRARDALDDALNGDKDYSRYERDWRDREIRLERERVRTMARIAGVSESRIRGLRRDGISWEAIARRYHIEPKKFGWGFSRYDRERDAWKGVPPGLAKKGSPPPGRAKKLHGRDKGPKHKK